MKGIAFAVGNGAVRTADIGCPNLAFLFERQGWMKRISLE
jgi:hypothetical protein